MESVLPRQVVAPDGTGEGDYLMEYINPETREAVEQLIPRGELERIRYKQRELHNEIVRFTEAKAREFYDFCDQLVREHRSRLAAQRESSSLSTRERDSASPPGIFPSHSSSRTSIRSDSPKVPLKSSFKTKPGSSVTLSESESASGQKSPKRVMFASQPEVYTPEESGSEDEQVVSGSDTDDDEVNGVAGNLPQHSVAGDDSSMTDNSARVLNVQADPAKDQGYDYNDDEDDSRSTEDLFEFDESLGVDIPPAQEASTTFNEQEALDLPTTTGDADSRHLGLVNPALASSLPQPNMISSVPRLSGNFKPPAQSKYVLEDIEEGSDPPSRSSTASIPISSGLAARPTVISPYAASLPIQISQSRPWSLSAQQASDSNHSSVTGATPLPTREQQHMTEDLEWATLLNHGETTDNPFNQSSTNMSTDPSKMSFSERLLMEEQKRPGWNYG